MKPLTNCLLMGLFLAALPGKSSLHAATSNVSIVDFGFQPANVTIQVGDTVTWANQGGFNHTSTSGTSPVPDGLWASGLLPTPATFSHAFNSPGSFPYFCTPHPFMLGSVTVQSANGRVWIGGTGDWTSAANWDPALVPTAADNVFITNSGTYTVTVPASTSATAASVTIGGPSGTQSLAIDRATLTLAGLSVVNLHGELELLVSQSVVDGAGSLTVDGTLNFANGTISGTGVLTIDPTGVLAIGSSGVTLGRTLNNSGICTWNGGNLTIVDGTTINNLTGATFDIAADGRLNGAASTPINNSGLFRQSAGTTGTSIIAPFNNIGSLQVLTSTLNLNLGGTHTGTFTVNPGATLNLGGGSHDLSAGSLVSAGSSVSLGGGATLTASGTFGPGSTLNLISGVATLTSSCDVTAATLAINGANCVANYNTLGSINAVSLTQGTLGGLNPVNVTGPLTLAGGSVTNALVNANGGLAINGNTTLNGGKLVNPSLAIWSGGRITGANGAVISNLLGATFINTFDGNAATGAGATPSFINDGLFQKSNGTAAAGATSIDFEFVNTGTVEVQTNTLRYGPNQQLAGLTLLDGGDLSAQAQPLQILGGSLVGAGLVSVANNQSVINSSALSPGFPLGRLDIDGNYQQTGSGVLNVELGGYAAGTTFDLVTVTAGGAGGVASLGGRLSITLANGFSPTNGASFTFLTADSRVGAFATFDYPSNELGMQVSYDATSAKILVSNLKPVVANPISDPPPTAYGAAFNLQFPANTFTDPDGDVLTYTASGLPPGVTFSGSTRTFSGAPTQTGVFPVLVAATDSGTPSLSVTNAFTITVTPAILTITAEAKAKPYGAADPALTYTVSGLQFTDTQASVLTGALARTAGETVAGGPYAITQGTLAANGSYTINFTGSTLAITPATLTIAAEAKTKIYGAADPAFTYTTSGLQFTDTQATALTGALTRAAGETVAGSPYPITQGALAANGNYTLNFTGSTLTITPAPLSITADDKTKTYGETDPTFTVSFTGFVNGETQATLGGILAFTRAPGENPGTYSITPSGLTSTNYAVTFVTGTLTIGTLAPSIFPLAVTGTNIVVTWSAISNTTYRIQYKLSLDATNWTDLTGDVLSSGNKASKIDDKTTTNRFYRVQALP